MSVSDSSDSYPFPDPGAELDLSDLLNNLQISNSSTPEIMAKPQFDVKMLTILPNFDGNPNDLHDFINVSTTLLNHYFDFTPANVDCIQNKIIIHGITSKLSGRAKEVISIHGCKSWDTIKNTLIQNFGDQRDENALTRDLVNLRQAPNESPISFYERCTGLLNTICNYIDLHNNVENIRNNKKDFFRRQTLTTFLAGLREPLGSTIRAMRPTTLALAMMYIQEENNIRYLQRSNTPQIPIPRKPQPQPRMQYHLPPPNYTPRNQNYYQIQPQPSQAPPQPKFPTGPIPVMPRSNNQPQKYFTNQQVFGKPQNVWTPKNTPTVLLPKPTPMSTTSRYTAQPNKKVPAMASSKIQTPMYNIEQQEQVYYPYYYPNYGENVENPYYEETAQEEEISTEPQDEYVPEEDGNFPVDANHDQLP